jgi:preprotein translocase subunit SecE
MNLPKLFQKKNEDDRSVKVQRMDAQRKNIQKPAKVKKMEAVRKTARKSDESRFAWWHNARQYLREVSSELRKVVWPSRKETIGSTSVVLVIVALSGVFLGIVDLILSRLVRLIVG